jgi:hypothetical protein
MVSIKVCLNCSPSLAATVRNDQTQELSLVEPVSRDCHGDQMPIGGARTLMDLEDGGVERLVVACEKCD